MNEQQYNKVKAACEAWIAKGNKLIRGEFYRVENYTVYLRGEVPMSVTCGCALTAVCDTVSPVDSDDSGVNIQAMAQDVLRMGTRDADLFLEGFDCTSEQEHIVDKYDGDAFFDAGRRLAKEVGL